MPEPSLSITIGTAETIVGLIAIILTAGIAWGIVKRSVNQIEKILEHEVKPDLKNVRERFAAVESKVDTLWKDAFAPASSPRQLNERGQSVLEESGIRELLDEKKEKILELIKDIAPPTPYDAEQAVLEVVEKLPEEEPGLINEIKEGAFRTGADIETVLFVGGMYMRDKILPELGFSLTDIDSDHPKLNLRDGETHWESS